VSTSPDIFLSYGREDQATARRFAERLEAQGFTVWWDAALRTGESFDQAIEKALNEAKAVVVLWSRTSVDSRWVRAEATMAARNKTLAPVMIEACQRPIMFELTHTADLSHWTGDAKDKAWQSFVGDLRRFIEQGGPQGAAAAADRPPHAPPATLPWYRGRSAIIAIASLLIAIALSVLYLRLHAAAPVLQPASAGAAAASTPVAIATSPQAAPGVSLAVLPFVDMSPQHDQDYFSDGLSEELLNQLAQIKNLHVAGRTSSFSFKNKNEDLRVIGEKLGVNHLLEGSVRKAADRVRITAQLIDGRNGTHLWSQTYDRKLDDIFAVQEDIARDVARVLSVTLDVGEMPRAQGGTTNVEAYDRFLRALNSTDGHQRLNLLHEAVAIDPTFSRAWVLLQDDLLAETLFGDPGTAATIKAELADVRARIEALAPEAWWTHYMHVETCTQDRRWAECEVAARKMIAAAPASEYLALDQYGYFLMSVGRFREAVDYRRRARDTEPLRADASEEYQTALIGAGLTAEALAESERGKQLEGYSAAGDIKLLWRIMAAKDADVATVKAELRVTASPGFPPTSLNRVLADKIGNRTEALAVIHTAFMDPVRGQNPMGLFGIYKYADYFGDKDLALEALGRSFALKNVAYPWIWLPNRTDLRSDPRFKMLLRELGIVDYWRRSGNWGDFCHPVGSSDFECH
jgi:TolB-like protein